MGWLDRLFPKREPTPLPPRPGEYTDPDFGLVWYLEDGFWEGESTLYDNRNVGISFDGDESGPHESARRLFHEIAANYDSIQRQTCEQILNSTGDSVSQSELTITHIGISSSDDPPTLQLTFRIQADPEHGYIANIQNWNVVHVCLS